MAAPATAADYPVRPVRMIVPLAPGGGSDIVGRFVAQALTDRWGQSVVVDNRPGAGSIVGTGIAAKAAGDGYTLLVSSSSIAISPALHRSLPFDVRRDLAPVTLLASQPSLLAVHPAVPAHSVRELIDLARARPGKLAYASAGVGSATHLGSELFRSAAGIDLVHVAYKSAGQAATALLSGEAQILLTNMATALPHARTGRLRALAVTGAARSAQAPTLPTVAESGVPGFEYTTWYGMLVPAGTPAALVTRLQADTASALRLPAMLERLGAQGLDVVASTPAAFGAYLGQELARWERVIKAAGIRAD